MLSYFLNVSLLSSFPQLWYHYSIDHLYEKIQYNKILRKKYRNYKSKSLNFMLDASEKNHTEFWKILNSLKEKGDYPSTSISPQDWFAYFNFSYNTFRHKFLFHGDLVRIRPKLLTCLNLILHSSSCQILLCKM
jgi:hypothetical protein